MTRKPDGILINDGTSDMAPSTPRCFRFVGDEFATASSISYFPRENGLVWRSGGVRVGGRSDVVGRVGVAGLRSLGWVGSYAR